MDGGLKREGSLFECVCAWEGGGGGYFSDEVGLVPEKYIVYKM